MLAQNKIQTFHYLPFSPAHEANSELFENRFCILIVSVNLGPVNSIC